MYNPVTFVNTTMLAFQFAIPSPRPFRGVGTVYHMIKHNTPLVQILSAFPVTVDHYNLAIKSNRLDIIRHWINNYDLIIPDIFMANVPEQLPAEIYVAIVKSWRNTPAALDQSYVYADIICTYALQHHVRRLVEYIVTIPVYANSLSKIACEFICRGSMSIARNIYPEYVSIDANIIARAIQYNQVDILTYFLNIVPLPKYANPIPMASLSAATIQVLLSHGFVPRTYELDEVVEYGNVYANAVAVLLQFGCAVSNYVLKYTHDNGHIELYKLLLSYRKPMHADHPLFEKDNASERLLFQYIEK